LEYIVNNCYYFLACIFICCHEKILPARVVQDPGKIHIIEYFGPYNPSFIIYYFFLFLRLSALMKFEYEKRNYECFFEVDFNNGGP